MRHAATFVASHKAQVANGPRLGQLQNYGEKGMNKKKKTKKL